jgi:tetratricopeptide (TPR) repeat protein
MLNNSGGSAYNLNALGTYWNNGNPVYAHFYIGQGSQIDASLYLSTDPWAGIPLPSMARGNTGTPQGPGIVDSTIADPLSDGIQFRFEGKFNEAKDFFISYLGKNPNDQRAYVELYNCYNNKIANEITSYFEKLPSFASNEQKLLLGYLYLKQGKIKSAKDVNNQIISQNSNTPLASRGKLNNFYITLYNENDMKGAASILSDVISKKDLLTPTEISIAQNALKTYVPANTLKGEISPKGSEEKVIQTTPSAYKLEQNYPNPFNPTTTISYQLSADSHVTLKVFDVLGREVAVLVNGQKNAGSYKATFDGTKFASGVYIYQLKANDYLENKKMILTK